MKSKYILIVIMFVLCNHCCLCDWCWSNSDCLTGEVCCADGDCKNSNADCCLSENGAVLIKDGDRLVKSVLLRDVVIGDYIFDGDSFTKVLTVEYGSQQNMLTLLMKNINNSSHVTTVTMTGNHLLFDVNNKLISAGDIKIGDIIFNDLIVQSIKNDEQYSLTPYTFSGYLQVNGIKASCYVYNEKLANLSHEFLWIFRWFSENINEQIPGKILQQISYYRYYLKFEQLLGEEIMENKFWFTIIAVLFIPFIIAENLFFAMSFQHALLIGCIVITSMLLLRMRKEKQ